MKIEKIYHVAYRCRDARETVLWYQKMLNMDFVLAIAEDEVPSTHEPDPYMHVFLDAGMGNVLAFFELPTRNGTRPEWPPAGAGLSRSGRSGAAGQAGRGEMGHAGRMVAHQARAETCGLPARRRI